MPLSLAIHNNRPVIDYFLVELTGRSSLRHLELHAFQVKDFVDNGEINVVWCPGDDCIADVYTKAVDTAKFKRFSSLLLGDGPTTIEKALVVNAVHSYRTFWLELDVPFAERRAASTATVFGSRRPALVQ